MHLWTCVLVKESIYAEEMKTYIHLKTYNKCNGGMNQASKIKTEEILFKCFCFALNCFFFSLENFMLSSFDFCFKNDIVTIALNSYQMLNDNVSTNQNKSSLKWILEWRIFWILHEEFQCFFWMDSLWLRISSIQFTRPIAQSSKIIL